MMNVGVSGEVVQKARGEEGGRQPPRAEKDHNSATDPAHRKGRESTLLTYLPSLWICGFSRREV